jgi:hypothetical protein
MSVGSIRDEFQRQLNIARCSEQAPATSVLTGRPMPAPNSIKGLPGKLRDHLAALTARAEKTAGEVEGSVKNMHARLDDVDKTKRDIDTAAAQIQEITGMDNGGPELSK